MRVTMSITVDCSSTMEVVVKATWINTTYVEIVRIDPKRRGLQVFYISNPLWVFLQK